MVCGTGLATQLGEISSSLRRTPPPSALDLGTHKFGMLIVQVTEVLVLFVLLINLLLHRPWLESFLFAVALAVGLTPELLPMIVSVTLARGALRMAKAQVIVKQATTEAALARRQEFVVTLLCGDDMASSTSLQLAVLTAASIAVRCFPGAVRTAIPPKLADAPPLVWLQLKLTFGRALRHLLGSDVK